MHLHPFASFLKPRRLDKDDDPGNAPPADEPPADEADDGEAGEETERSALDAVSEALGLADEEDAAKVEAPEGEALEPAREPEAGKEPLAEAVPGEQKQAEKDPFAGPLEGKVAPETQKRFEKMIESHNALVSSHTELEAQYEDLVSVMRDTGAPSEELANGFEYLRLRNSTDPQDWRLAQRVLAAELADISSRLGEDAPDVDLLADFEDLKERVENAELTRADAIELASARRQRQAKETTVSADRQAKDKEQQYNQAMNAGLSQLKALDESFKKDPDYPDKRAIVDRQLDQIVKNNPPDRWAAVYKSYWDLVDTTAANLRAGKTPSKRQPFSGSAGGSGATKEPKTAIDAVAAALGMPTE